MNAVINKPAAPWFIESIDGTNVPLPNDFIGKPLLILFYYLGCPGCIGRAIPFANRMKYEYQDKLNVIGIHSNFQGPEYTDEQILRNMKKLYARFNSYRDAGLATTFHDYEGGGTPHWIVIDENGIVVESIFGSDPNRALLRLDYKFQEMISSNE